MAQTNHIPDLTKITLRQYRSLFDKSQTQEQEDNILALVFGFESADAMLDGLSQPEYKRLLREMLEQIRDPESGDSKNS